jgi:hypothetical protein
MLDSGNQTSEDEAGNSMIDFDDIDDWSPRLAFALGGLVPASVAPSLENAKLRYVEDACDMLFRLADREAILDATLTWLTGETLAGYHGSRLTDDEVTSIQTTGLIPLDAGARRERLARALARHPRWPEVSGQLDEAIARHGAGNRAGNRVGQVHLTLSGSGLAEGFNHYLTHGAEFDQHVAQSLLGPEGKELLAQDGMPTVIRVAVPGGVALDAAHPYFSISDLRERGEVPNIAGDFLEAWSYRLAHPGFQSRTLEVDCGLVFHAVVPPEWIVGVEKI